MFICVRGLDVSSATGSQVAHRLMKMTQKAAYTMVCSLAVIEASSRNSACEVCLFT